MDRSSGEAVTELLEAAQHGDTDAFDALFELVYDELRRLAHVVRRGRAGQTINTTALVHEAYAKLLPSFDLSWRSRAHFFRIAARAMRQVLMNAAERRMAEKRGGDQITVHFDERVYRSPVRLEELVELNDALTRLEDLDSRQAQVVECRFFAGLTVDETAEALDVSTPTVVRDWRTARAWLADALR